MVETRNFPAETAPQRASDQVVMTERFTAGQPDVVEWRVTFDDPTTWTRPWTYMMPLTKVDRSQEVHEYACHEGNLAMRNILSAARAAERQPPSQTHEDTIRGRTSGSCSQPSVRSTSRIWPMWSC